MRVFDESAELVEALGKIQKQRNGKRRKKTKDQAFLRMANVHERDTPSNDMISMLTRSGAKQKTSTRFDAARHLHVDELYFPNGGPMKKHADACSECFKKQKRPLS